jgi:hypothetical protein
MSSIALEPNSVQSTSNQSTSNQANQIKDTENLHIANDTTNENNSKNEAKSVNKYIYPEFEGRAGYDYLLSIAQKVMPYAYWRTWMVADSYQAPGQRCYVSVEKICEKAGPKARKIYLDLEGMQRREWLKLKRIRMDFLNEEGILVTRPVTDKDFSGFYHTAHDYHLWRTSREYIAPEWDNVPLILEDEALIKRLIRFENYRRLLVCEKPGRKSLQEQNYYEEQEERVAQKRTSVQEVNQYLNSRENTLTLNLLESTLESKPLSMVPNLRPPGGETDIGATAIRNVETEQTKQQEKQRSEEETYSKPKPPPFPERESAAAAKRVKTVNGYTEEELKRDTQKRGAAAAGIPAEHYQKLAGEKDDAEEQEQQPASQNQSSSRPAREIPAQLVQEVTQYAEQYDSPHLVNSDVTRAAKIYFTAAQTVPSFQDRLFWAFYDEAVQAAKRLRGCESTNSKGRVNRVPYFFTCLENAFRFSLEELVYLRTEEPLYSEYTIWDMINHLRRTYKEQVHNEQMQLTYRQWLECILDRQEHRKHPKSRKNVTAKEY